MMEVEGYTWLTDGLLMMVHSFNFHGCNVKQTYSIWFDMFIAWKLSVGDNKIILVVEVSQLAETYSSDLNVPAFSDKKSCRRFNQMLQSSWQKWSVTWVHISLLCYLYIVVKESTKNSGAHTHRVSDTCMEKRERCVKPGCQGKEGELDGSATTDWQCHMPEGNGNMHVYKGAFFLFF